MTREQAKLHINSKLLSDDLLILGDGDTFDLVVTDRHIDELADLEFPEVTEKDSA